VSRDGPSPLREEPRTDENATSALKAQGAKTSSKAMKRAGRESSKTARVLAMLQRRDGATLMEIMEQMCWQKHTVRGFMAGAMKRAGYTVESFKSGEGERSYRISQRRPPGGRK
jgi:uncharacterized protein DUF3489